MSRASSIARFASNVFDMSGRKGRKKGEKEKGVQASGEQRLQQNKPLNNEFRE